MRRLIVLILSLLLILPFAPAAAADPIGVTIAVAGEPRLGGTLRAQFDWHGTEPDTYPSYRWLVDGVPLDESWAQGYRGEGFSPNTSQFGKRISVEARIQVGDVTAVVVSPEVGPVGSGPLEVQAYLDSGSEYTGDPIYAVTWSWAEGVTYSYAWFLDGVPVAGATGRSFTPDHTAVGKLVSARVTASAVGWTDGVVVTRAEDPLLAGWLPDGAVIKGTPEVGEEVSAGILNLGGAEGLAYEWRAAGKVVGTSPRLELGPDLEGRTLQLTVIVMLRKKPNRYTDEVVVRASSRRTPAPRITGSAMVGWPLTAHLDPWNPRPLREHVQWKRTRGGVTEYIDGATSATYRLTGEDLGATITVERIGEMPPFGNLTTASSKPTAVVAFNVYSTPGEHVVAGRQWRTQCAPYSQTQRCRTEIRATQIVRSGTTYRHQTGWVFNNLTYLPSPESLWKANPLGKPGEFVSGGRPWRTECRTPTTGGNACRSYLRTSVISATAQPGGGYRYSVSQQWVFNNMVLFS